ncbi:flavodoxin family protein [Lactobacillus sp. S2-2]|uniref:NAD(P)H-dependent oxidoreductase n=1 Tax=Lactobacillus sp. S2-2 TaxID=2692917 RepID=UPI001F38AA39|nr:NAD(P)H-dependent oxidoreductase [Lactobacillus sp. S2-2]MCF6514680.1 flavodoxin family protein [Lactobacillus sp. S2-2]
MKTLIIISHPEILDSATQSFLKATQKSFDNVTWHSLEVDYDNDLNKLDIEYEKQLLKENDRIIFQFPLYWYSAPASLKKWQDEVLTRTFTYKEDEGLLKGKELGIVTSIGNSLDHFQAGGFENFSLSEILIPYQALAKRAGMMFMKPLIIDQFIYMNEETKYNLYISYQKYISTKQDMNFTEKTNWLIDQLTNHYDLNNNDIIDQLKINKDDLDDLKMQINLMRQDEEG